MPHDRRIAASERERERVTPPGLGLSHRRDLDRNCGTTISGYTLLEIVVVLIVVGILAAVLAPRFIGTSGFTGQTTADKFLAAARYAESLAQNQDVTTSLTVSAHTFSITQNGAPVADPTLQSPTFVVTLPAGVRISPRKTTKFYQQQGTKFKQQGLPNNGRTFQITSAGPTVKVYVRSTGYIYGCQPNGPCP